MALYQHKSSTRVSWTKTKYRKGTHF
jgi:hypothetical protein